MIAGFVVLGVTSIVFGAGLGRVIRPRSAGPSMIIVAGAATIALGVFRRDHLLLTSPGFTGESWHNRLVAVKVIRPELAGEPGFRARFAREVAAARNVGGLFTALVVDDDAQGPVPWLATAYVRRAVAG